MLSCYFTTIGFYVSAVVSTFFTQDELLEIIGNILWLDGSVINYAMTALNLLLIMHTYSKNAEIY